MKRKYPARLNSKMILQAFRAQYGDAVYHQLMESHFITVIWPQVLGTALSSYAVAQRIDQGTLFVRVTSSALRNDLFMQRTVLIEKLNLAAGQQVIHAIVFR
jgi:hypothetical protein